MGLNIADHHPVRVSRGRQRAELNYDVKKKKKNPNYICNCSVYQTVIVVHYDFSLSISSCVLLHVISICNELMPHLANVLPALNTE